VNPEALKSASSAFVGFFTFLSKTRDEHLAGLRVDHLRDEVARFRDGVAGGTARHAGVAVTVPVSSVRRNDCNPRSPAGEAGR
jgi:hypothetical protein